MMIRIFNFVFTMKGGNFQMVLIREYYDVNFVLVDLLDKNENIMLAYVGVQ